MLDHRVHVLLDEKRYRKALREARRRRISVGAVIRDALDRLPEDDVRQEAIDAILDAEPMPVPLDPADLRRELDGGRDRLTE